MRAVVSHLPGLGLLGQAKPAAEYAGKGWNGRSPEESRNQQSARCCHVNEAQHNNPAAVHMHRCASDDRTQQEVAKVAKCGLESTKTRGKQQVYAIAWPHQSQLVCIGRDGRCGFRGGRGPWGTRSRAPGAGSPGCRQPGRSLG